MSRTLGVSATTEKRSKWANINGANPSPTVAIAGAYHLRIGLISPPATKLPRKFARPLRRAVVEMKVFEAMTQKETARHFNCSPKTVATCWNWAQRWLREGWAGSRPR